MPIEKAAKTRGTPEGLRRGLHPYIMLLPRGWEVEPKSIFASFVDRTAVL